MQLEIALHELNNSITCGELLFWGKIAAEKGDYFIAMAVDYEGKYEFPDKRFFFAHSSNFKFEQMPDPLDQHNEFVNLNTEFSGDSNKILEKLEPDEGEGEEPPPEEPADGEGEGEDNLEDTSSEDEAVKVPPKNYTELHRLVFTVRAIENDCQILPQGSVKLTPHHEVRRNEAFKGLCCDNAYELKSYIHFRSAQSEEKRNLNEQDDAIFRTDFLESIDNDCINGSWSIQPDTTGSQTVIKSLLWPGYIGYHKLYSKQYGGIYLGDGIKNADLPFML